MTVKVSIPGITAMRKAVEGNPRLNAAIANAWSTIYRAFARQRFDKLSKGGSVDGDSWKPLSPVTIKRRRKGRGSGSALVLRDTGAMFAAMQPGTTGGILQQQNQPLGVTIYLGGGKSYKSGPTLTEVATFHHHGRGRLPAREILAKPSRDIIERMAAVAHQIVSRGLNDAKGGA